MAERFGSARHNRTVAMRQQPWHFLTGNLSREKHLLIKPLFTNHRYSRINDLLRPLPAEKDACLWMTFQDWRQCLNKPHMHLARTETGKINELKQRLISQHLQQTSITTNARWRFGVRHSKWFAP